MNRSSFLSSRFVLLMVLLLLTTLIPAATVAKQPPPPTPQRPGQDFNVIAPDRLGQAAKDQPASPAEERAVAPKPATAQPLPPASTTAIAPSVITPSLQGAVQLDVAVPATIRAGQNITFTYTYTNTGASPVSGISIKAIWPYNIVDANSVIYCAGDNCAANTLSGPTVTRDPLQPNPTFATYQLGGALNNNQVGKFAVYMRSNAGYYPRTGQQPTRPSGSAELYIGANPSPTSDDTASSLIVGPVFYMTKTVSNAVPIYPVIETAVFTLTVGNATGPGDVVSGNRRADARNATNVVLTDFFPLDGIFVSATPSVGSVVTTTGKLTWTFPSLPVGQTQQVSLRFKKGDTALQCNVLNNYNYNVTSTEMPSGQLPVSGQQSAAVNVLVPMRIASIVFVPSSIIFGNQFSANVIVENYWNQDLTGVVLNYDIQSNADYAGGATPPTPINGKRLSWTFNMPKATSKTTPSTKTFSFNLLAGYTTQVNPAANAQLILPAGIPSQCMVTISHAASIRERLSFRKTTTANRIVKRGQQVDFTITVQNDGSSGANGVKVVDLIPSGPGANFSYVAGSGTLNGASHAPDLIQNGNNGRLEWNNLNVPAGQSIVLGYSLIVQGDDYFTYCNIASVTGPQGESVINGGNQVCLKINPNIDISKEIVTVPPNPQPGDTVRFRLTLTNHETTPYTLGLYDFYNDYVNVRQVTGYATPASDGPSRLKWPSTTLAPGDQVSAEIDADIPNVCQTRSYSNEALFWYTSATVGDVIVEREPAMVVAVQVICGKIEYSKNIYSALAQGNVASLGDRVGYQISNFNADSIAYNNVQVDDYLPAGFTYDSMDATSSLSTPPTQQTVTVVNPQTQQNETRIKLHWTIPTMASGATVNIKYIARAGAVVGVLGNWAQVLDVGLCKSDCIAANGGNILSRYNVTVAPLITTEPSLNPSTCALPNEVRTYKLALVNTNNHIYTSTGVTVTLPLGLKYVSTVGDTPPPTVTTDNFGVTTVAWNKLAIQTGSPFYEKDLLMNLQIGQVWGDLGTVVQATSPDGLIPLKDGATNVAVTVCPPGPAIAKDVTRSSVRIGDEIVYQISLANPTASPITTNVIDQLPAGLSYVAMVPGKGANPSGTSPLTWNVTVPAAVNGKPGSVILQFRVHVDSGTVGTVYINTATSSPAQFDTNYATVNVTIPGYTYMPLAVR